MFKAREATLGTIFDNGEYEQFIVPIYQRTYVWGVDELENFWNDFLVRSPDGGIHLIGSIIISKARGLDKVFGVVDGQQRLITGSIFLAALRDEWGKIFGQEEEYYDLHRFLVKSNRNKSQTIKIKAPGVIRENFENIVINKDECETRPTNIDSKAITFAYKYLRDRIHKDYIDKPGIHDKEKRDLLWQLKDNLFNTNCIIVTLENEDDAYEVFEGFNARGVDLSIADLFKNLILQKIRGDAAKQEQALLKWNEINQIVKDLNIPKFNINTFLRYFWISEHSYIGEKQLYKRMKKETTDYDLFLTRLHKTALNLRVLFSDDPWEVKELIGGELKSCSKLNDSIRGLKVMNTQSYIVWLMALTDEKNRDKVSATWIANSIKSVENFSFRYFAVSKQPANKIEKDYAKLARNLYKAIEAEDSDALQTAVLNEWPRVIKDEKLLPSEEQYYEDFETISLQGNNKPFIRYLLSNLEHAASTAEKKVDQQEVNIEHILPQKPGEEWNVDAVTLKANLNRLGNLTILLGKLNSTMSNKPISDKIGTLKSSGLEINKRLVKFIEENQTVWGADQISTRQLELAKAANTVWKI